MNKKVIRYLLIISGILLIIIYIAFIIPLWGIPFNKQRHGYPPKTPAWALECWLWEDDVNTAARVDVLLNGYRKYDIPVRTILLDSPWSLRYNDYQVDTVRYPEPDRWFRSLQDRGYRVVLWATSMVNSFNKDTRIQHSTSWFNHARKQGYLSGNGYQINWWKGKGAFIDYTNPDAMHWWHGMQQQVFRYGIDGWKLDGTATLFRSKAGPVPLFMQKTSTGWMSTRKYMDHYYREEYRYGLGQHPEFITLSRSFDRGYHPEGFAPIDASPVNWVGDQEHYWESTEDSVHNQETGKDIALKGVQGFESAIKNILRSARKGYSVIGSDVAGFSGSVIPPRLYIRWAQFSAFCGLFLNGGHGERALWKRSDEELEIIRKYAWLHTELVPYMYRYVVEAHQGEKVLQRPLGGDYQYMFGDYLLVAPIFEDNLSRTVKLPSGTWRYWFEDTTAIYGKTTIKRDYPLDEYPVYIKEGAVIPLHITRDYTGIGDHHSAGFLTLLIYPADSSSFTVYHPAINDQSTGVSVQSRDQKIQITLSGVKIPHILKIYLPGKPSQVMRDGVILRNSIDYQYIQEQKKLVIRTSTYLQGKYIIST